MIEQLEQRALLTTYTVNFTSSAETVIMGYNSSINAVAFFNASGLSYDLSQSGNTFTVVGTHPAGTVEGITPATGNVFDIYLNAGNDNFSVDPIVVTSIGVRVSGDGGDDTVTGGAGNDTIFGNANADTLDGGGGDDFMDGGSGHDSLYGNTGHDTLIGGSGDDILDGWSGSDTVSYGYTSNNLRINLSEAGNDYEYDGNTTNILYTDNVSNIETIIGGTGNDRLTGANNANFIRGGDGSDTIDGQGGADTLWGDGGNDHFYAQDTVQDLIDGGSGTDTMFTEDVGVDILSNM